MAETLQVVVLGSGTAIPDPDRFPAGYLVRHGGWNVLVDLGPGILRRLPAAGLDLEDLDAVFLTHYHTDHCADLAALLFALRNPRYRGRPPLRVFGAPGLVRLHSFLAKAWPWLQPRPGDFALLLHEIHPGQVPAELLPEGLEVRAISIRHTAQSLGYRLTAAGRTVAFSGDADECPELIDLARSADLFVCDCAFPDGEKQEGHLTPTLAARAASAAGAGTLCLTHFYPECDGHDLAAEAAPSFAGPIVLARDLMVLEP